MYAAGAGNRTCGFGERIRKIWSSGAVPAKVAIFDLGFWYFCYEICENNTMPEGVFVI